MRSSIQGVSTRCVAMPAQNCKIGDYRLWNGGSRTKLIKMEPKGKTQLTMTYEDTENPSKPDVRVLARKTPVVMMNSKTSRDFLSEKDRPTPTI